MPFKGRTKRRIQSDDSQPFEPLSRATCTGSVELGWVSCLQYIQKPEKMPLLLMQTIPQAKGYPDISTRSFLHKLSTSTDDGMPSPSVLALTDFDPDGIAIMSTYKHGSQQLSHETEKLKVPSIQWLGIKSANVKHNIDRMDDHDSQGLLSLSLRDRKKAVKMLENNVVFAEDGSEQEWRRELQVLMMLGAKAEMEILDERSEGLAEWVEQKLEEQVQASREWYTNVSVGAPESLDMDMGLELLEGS